MIFDIIMWPLANNILQVTFARYTHKVVIPTVKPDNLPCVVITIPLFLSLSSKSVWSSSWCLLPSSGVCDSTAVLLSS